MSHAYSLADMQFLTVAEYAKLKGISHQTIYQRIKRKTLKVVLEKVEVEEYRIPVDDSEMESVKQ